MLFLYTAGIVSCLAVLCFIFKAVKPSSEWENGGFFFSFIAVALVIIGFLVSSIEWAEQISDFEDVKKFQKVEAIYQSKAEVLTAEFAKHLAETYPEHEKNIYDKISPDKVSMYFAKYPELRTSDTLVALVEHINKLQSDVYDQQIKAEQMLKNIRFRLRNPWFYTFMIPSE